MVIDGHAFSLLGQNLSRIDSVGIRSQRIVSHSEFGNQRPLTVDRGMLRCDRSAVTFEHNNTVYEVNETAKGRGAQPIDPI